MAMFSSHYGLFCLGALALIAAPGPDFLYVATRGIAGGRGAGVVSALGIGAGLLVHTLLAASGLTLLLLASSAAFTFVKWLGAAYLLLMGFKMLRAGDELLSVSPQGAFSLRQTFRQGVLTNVFNPKVALTFAAFLPPFVQSEGGSAALQIAGLGATLCVLATLWFCGVGFFAGQLGAMLGRRPQIGRAVRLGAGFILMGLGIALALGVRPSIGPTNAR